NGLRPSIAQSAVVFLGPAFVAVAFNAKGLALEGGLHAAGDFPELVDFTGLHVGLVVLEVNRLALEFGDVLDPSREVAVRLLEPFPSLQARRGCCGGFRDGREMVGLRGRAADARAAAIISDNAFARAGSQETRGLRGTLLASGEAERKGHQCDGD